MDEFVQAFSQGVLWDSEGRDILKTVLIAIEIMDEKLNSVGGMVFSVNFKQGYTIFIEIL